MTTHLEVEEPITKKYLLFMTIQLPPAVEADLRSLAKKQGRDVLSLIEDAVQQYMDGAAITDVSSADLAAAQISVLDALAVPSPWHGDPT